MGALIKRPFGSEAFAYIRERLASGHTFAHALDQALDIEGGSVFAYLPEDLSDEHAYQFREGVLPTPPESTWRRVGGGIMIPTPNTNEWLASRIVDFLSTGERRFAIFEEWTAKPTDPFWQNEPKLREAATFVRDEVYYVVRSDDQERASDAVKWAGGPWPGLLGALARGNGELRDDAKHWSALANATIELAIGAYDGESYLIWMRA